MIQTKESKSLVSREIRGQAWVRELTLLSIDHADEGTAIYWDPSGTYIGLWRLDSEGPHRIWLESGPTGPVNEWPKGAAELLEALVPDYYDEADV